MMQKYSMTVKSGTLNKYIITNYCEMRTVKPAVILGMEGVLLIILPFQLTLRDIREGN
jgi:hypothetical protein